MVLCHHSHKTLNYSDAVEFLQSVKLDENGIPERTGNSWKGGTQGLSAYQVTVENGFIGTESEWLKSLIGHNGVSAYQIVITNGFIVSEQDWLNECNTKAEYGMITGALSAQSDLSEKLETIKLKVDKVNGTQLSTNDYKNGDKYLVSTIQNKLESHNIVAGDNVTVDIYNNDDVKISFTPSISGAYYEDILHQQINELRKMIQEIKK